jgi:hypothetical protein
VSCTAKSVPQGEIPQYIAACCGDRNFEDFAFIALSYLQQLSGRLCRYYLLYADWRETKSPVVSQNQR